MTALMEYLTYKNDEIKSLNTLFKLKKQSANTAAHLNRLWLRLIISDYRMRVGVLIFANVIVIFFEVLFQLAHLSIVKRSPTRGWQIIYSSQIFSNKVQQFSNMYIVHKDSTGTTLYTDIVDTKNISFVEDGRTIVSINPENNSHLSIQLNDKKGYTMGCTSGKMAMFSKTKSGEWICFKFPLPSQTLSPTNDTIQTFVVGIFNRENMGMPLDAPVPPKALLISINSDPDSISRDTLAFGIEMGVSELEIHINGKKEETLKDVVLQLPK